MRFFANPFFTAGFILCFLCVVLIFAIELVWYNPQEWFLFVDGLMALIAFILLFIGFKQVYGQEISNEVE